MPKGKKQINRPVGPTPVGERLRASTIPAARLYDEWIKRVNGSKIKCPYCGGTGHNEQANVECGFCDDGIHTIGE
jgi:hypothetical protein